MQGHAPCGPDRPLERIPQDRDPARHEGHGGCGHRGRHPVTKSLKGMYLEAALRLMLHELGMTYVVENEVLLITTNEAAESNSRPESTRSATSWTGAATKTAMCMPISIRLSTAFVPPSAPTDLGRGGRAGLIAKITMGTADALVISQTQEVHDEIVDLLGRLREAKRQSDLQTGGRKELPLRRAPGFVGGFGGMGGMGGFGGGMGGNAGGGRRNNAPVPGQQPVTPTSRKPARRPAAGREPARGDFRGSRPGQNRWPASWAQGAEEAETHRAGRGVRQACKARGARRAREEGGKRGGKALCRYQLQGRRGDQLESLTAARKERFGTKDMKVRAAAAKRIDAALHSPTQLEFVDCPLSDVIDYLKDYHQIEIRFDKKALDEAGISLDAPGNQMPQGRFLELGPAAGSPRPGPDPCRRGRRPLDYHAGRGREGTARPAFMRSDRVVPAWGMGGQSLRTPAWKASAA